ncbi:MAG: hypothetical protein IJL87_04490 [Clostridia bacterium]|nr:hypothetical protein [Clostridia bacterium]
MTDKKTDICKRAYAPYKREALYCFVLDAVLSAVLIPLIWLMDFPLLFLSIPLLFITETALNYRIGLLSYAEQKKERFVTEKVQFVSIADEYSASGHWGSVIPALYDKKLRMGRYKIKCTDQNGKLIRLRCAVSGKKWQIISDYITLGDSLPLVVTYGKLTHIIIRYEDKNDMCRKLNHSERI